MRREAVGFGVIVSIAWLIAMGASSAADNVWTSHGPTGQGLFAAASVIDPPIVVDPTDSNTIYVPTGVGIYKSTTGGASWTAVNTPAGVNKVIINPRTPSTLYATVGSLFGQSGIRSTNGGASWSPFTPLPTDVFGTFAVVVDPTNPDIIYALNTRISKSTNGGVSWAPAKAGLPPSVVTSLAVHPTAPNILYAGTFDHGVFRSLDGGATWSDPGNDGLIHTSRILTVAVDPTNPSVLYAGHDSYGVFKSVNGGAFWTRMVEGLPELGTGIPDMAVSSLVVVPQTPSTLYAGGKLAPGVFKSINGAASWSMVGTGLETDTATAIAVDPTNPNTVYAGTYGHGVFRLDQSATGQTAKLVAISTRSSVQAVSLDQEASAMIGGFVISGEPGTTKTVVIRVRGPSLTAFGVQGALSDPFVKVLSGQNTLAQNDDWQVADPTCQNTGNQCGTAADITGVGLSPCSPNVAGCEKEAAIYITLAPGAYTAIARGASGNPGIGLVEVYEVDATPAKLVAISTRGAVQAVSEDQEANAMIAGFSVGGSPGTQKTVIIRVRGPSLTAFGVQGALGDPLLKVLSGQTTLAQNNDWQVTDPTCQNTGNQCGTATGIANAGLSPCSPNVAGCEKESAIQIRLSPGAYTAIARGASGSPGIGIMEVYDVGN